ncbi:TonB-dependent receptor [Pelagicoccus albus]|uniref:TonB-dependent receptor n=1 Tax=Pelagicoccus albus TaxID=415222 RepID=A0A7X1EBB7_9BACT|nr:TonB-dependent receptor [Pelagicoccus albus]MBC2607627.1 TonB-dependent receptor [Pelagicoccus albus]
MNLFSTKTIAALTAGLALSAAHGETITGKVSASNNYGPIEGASIVVMESGLRTSTDKSGNFVIQNIRPGEYTLLVSYIGLGEETVKVSVAEGDIATVDSELGSDIVDLDPYVVSGSKSSSARAINLQRNSSNLVNAVAADAMGQFPDENAAEALQRVSGVSIERDQGEGRYVVIRGIDPDLNNVSLDGVTLAAPEADTRKVALDVIPTDLLDQLEVKKTFLPDMDGDAIGGSVNIKTISPFDSLEKIASVKTQLLYNDLVSKSSYMFAGTYGDTFGPEDNSGYVFSASYQEREFGSDNIEVDGPWSEETAEDGTSAYFAPEIEFRQYDVTRVRKSASLSFEHLASETTRLYARATYNYFSDQEYRYRTEIKPERGVIETITDTTATISGANRADRDLKDRFEEQEILALALGGDTRVDDWRFEYKASYSKGEEKEPNRLDTAFRNGDDTDYSYDFSDAYQPVVLATGGSDIFDPANYELDEFVVENNLAKEDETALKFDATRYLSFGETPAFVKFGAKYRSKEKSNDVNVDIYSNDSSDATLAGLLISGSRYSYFGDSDYMQFNSAAMRALLLSEADSLEYETEDSEIDSTLADYTTNEDVLAAYAMAEVEKGKWTFTSGLRVEQTDFETTGYELYWEEVDGEEVYGFNELNASNEYTDVLLSLNSRYALDHNTIVRASASNTISRPKFGQSSFQRETNRIDQVIETGNPDLDPYASTNFDISFEKYNETLGLFSANLFYKDIDSFIYVQETNPTIDGVVYEVHSPTNGESASILGLELVWNQDLSLFSESLTGFTIDANATFSDSESVIADGREIPFLKQSDEIINLGLAYENEKVMFRLAGTYRSEYLDGVGGDASEDEYIDSHLQLDAKFVYKLDEKSTIFLEAINLTEEPLKAYYGSPSRMRQYEAYSFSAKLGYSWKL